MSKCVVELIDKGVLTLLKHKNYSIDQKGITEWLMDLKIISTNEVLLTFNDILPWQRTGAETYGTSFKFSTDKQEKQIFVKAIVTLFSEKGLKDWAKRRIFLSKNGIPVSNWYYHGDSIIIEDFYSKSALEVVSFEKILEIGYKLDQLGFTTLKFLDDIRADDYGNPFFVDFGFDLGEPSEIHKTSAKEFLIKKFPQSETEIKIYYGKN